MAYSTTPKTTATISINSTGLTSDNINISQTFALTAIDNVTGLKNTTGVRRIEACNSGVIVFDSDKPSGQKKRSLSGDKLNKLIPNFKFTSIYEGINKTIDWFLTNYPNVRL